MAMITSPSAYTYSELQDAMRILPYMPMEVGKEGTFQDKYIATSTVTIGSLDGHVSLLVSNGRDTTKEFRDKGKIRTFQIPRFVHSEHIDSRDVQNYANATQGGLESMNQFMLDTLEPMRQHHELTHEWFRMGAIKGEILDGDGTVLTNLFTDFGVTQQVFNFALSSAATDVPMICRNIARYFEQLGQMGTPRIRVAPDFFDALISHPTVEKFYVNASQAVQMLNGGIRKGFIIGGVEFVEYAAQATDINGTVHQFIENGEGHAYMPNHAYFKGYFAPADFNEQVNLIPKQQVYVSIEPKPHNRGYHIHTQSNYLALPMNTKTLVKVLAV